MDQETRQCQNCKNEFVIEPDDFAFYEKVKIPAPTWCWSCRMARRMNFRNERTLYKRKCNTPAHEEEIISAYSDEKQTIYDQKYWWSDAWSPLDYGKDYDFSVSFFKQFKELYDSVPKSNLVNKNNANCDYVNWLDESKNCYLAFGGGWCENVLYANRAFYSKDSVDVYFVGKTDSCYENVNCQNSYRLFFGDNSENCVDSSLIYDCRGCSNCFGCVGLRKKQYHIFNEPYTKEEYLEKIKKLDLGSYKNLIENRKTFEEIKLGFPRKFASVQHVNDSTGDNISSAKNCKFIFDCVDGKNENSKFCFFTGAGIREAYDGVGCGVESELLCENVAATVSVAKTFFSVEIRESHNIYYSIVCHNSSNLFGCIGLRNKQYCIFNKQYTKEEYEALVAKIIDHINEMPYVDSKGRIYKYGEFFPSELSPFCYNETIAQEYFPLTKEQALEQGYGWKDSENRDYKVDILSENLPDHIRDVGDDIIGKVIECAHKGECNEQCTEAFKIIPQELQFYKRMNLPLPRVCPNCRHYGRLKQRNPLNLWHRKCMKPGCSNEFETSYASDRPETIYCESCYTREVA